MRDAGCQDCVGVCVASHPFEGVIERVPVRLIGEKSKQPLPPSHIVVTHREQIAQEVCRNYDLNEPHPEKESCCREEHCGSPRSALAGKPATHREQGGHYKNQCKRSNRSEIA